jgi:hypothetical protein
VALICAGTSARSSGATIRQFFEAAGDEHPWPAVIGGGHIGHWGDGEVAITRVEPDVVVEVAADTAFEHGRWRHLTRFVRPRPDLRPSDTVWPRPR